MNRSTRAALAIAVVCGVAAPAAAQVLPPPRDVVSLAASASVEVTRDWFTLVFSTTREGPDAAAVQSLLKQALNAALTEAKQAAEPGRVEVRTGAFSLSPRYAPPAQRSSGPTTAPRHRRLAGQHGTGRRGPRRRGHQQADGAHPQSVDRTRRIFALARSASEGRRRGHRGGDRPLPRRCRNRLPPLRVRQLFIARGLGQYRPGSGPADADDAHAGQRGEVRRSAAGRGGKGSGHRHRQRQRADEPLNVRTGLRRIK